MSKNPTVKQQVLSGFRGAGAWLLGMAWLGLVFWGMTEAFGTDANFAEGQHPLRALGYLLLSVAAVVFIFTANRWKGVFPGIMLVATLNSLIELVRGHSTGNSSVLIPHSVAFVQLLVIAGVTLLSFTFKKRPLNILDRIALLAFAASIYPGGDEVWHQKVPLALIIGGLCVLAAWAFNHVRRPEKPRPNHVVA